MPTKFGKWHTALHLVATKGKTTIGWMRSARPLHDAPKGRSCRVHGQGEKQAVPVDGSRIGGAKPPENLPSHWDTPHCSTEKIIPIPGHMTARFESAGTRLSVCFAGSSLSSGLPRYASHRRYRLSYLHRIHFMIIFSINRSFFSFNTLPVRIAR